MYSGRPDARACLCRGARAPAWPAKGARTRSWPARSAHARVPGRPLERARMPGRARRGTTGSARSARAWVRVEGRVRCGRAHAAARSAAFAKERIISPLKPVQKESALRFGEHDFLDVVDLFIDNTPLTSIKGHRTIDCEKQSIQKECYNVRENCAAQRS